LHKKNINKYIDTYCEKISFDIFTHLNHIPICDTCIVIPAKQEINTHIKLLESINNAAKKHIPLAITIVNSNQKDSTQIIDSNNNLLSYWEKNSQNNTLFSTEYFSYSKWKNVFLLMINCNQYPNNFLPTQGVGLARKIGSDVAIGLFNNNKLKSSLCFTTDADVTVENDYFSLIQNHRFKSKICYTLPFRHTKCASSIQNIATTLYENYLTTYVNGLKSANSPYAYHSIGSTLAYDYTLYAEVRGFSKKRLAGEDFYFLNKAAKVGTIITQPQQQPINIMNRLSKRTPFGTGRSLFKLIQQIEDKEKISHYSLQTFSSLKTWLILAKKACHYSSKTKTFKEKYILSTDELQKTLSKNFYNILKENSYLDKLDRSIKSSKHAICRLKHFNNWFDALETLKFIHILEKEKKK
jgi:hypothetical protein